MEPDNLLAHKVDIRRPELTEIMVPVVFKAQGGHVVEQGIDPHIDHMAGVKVHGHAPGEAGPGHAQVFQTGLNEVVDHLVDTAARLQEIRVFQQIPHPVGILRKPEEIGFLFRVLHLPAAVRALAVHQLALRPEGLAGLAVLALIGALVDVAVVVHLPENSLDGRHMIVVGGTDEPVVGNVHQLPQIQHTLLPSDNVVHKLLRGNAGLLGLVLNLLAVLIGAGEEHHVVALEPLEPSHGVGCHGAVGVADVQLGGRVINGGGNIVVSPAFFAHKYLLLNQKAALELSVQGRQKLTRYHLDSRVKHTPLKCL